jgi:hypothetical protein
MSGEQRSAMSVKVYQEVWFQKIRKRRLHGQVVLRVTSGEHKMNDVIVDYEVPAECHLRKIAPAQSEYALNGDNERVSVEDYQFVRERPGQ